jgi:hypothetical protein
MSAAAIYGQGLLKNAATVRQKTLDQAFMRVSERFESATKCGQSATNCDNIYVSDLQLIEIKAFTSYAFIRYCTLLDATQRGFSWGHAAPPVAHCFEAIDKPRLTGSGKAAGGDTFESFMQSATSGDLPAGDDAGV